VEVLIGRAGTIVALVPVRELIIVIKRAAEPVPQLSKRQLPHPKNPPPRDEKKFLEN